MFGEENVLLSLIGTLAVLAVVLVLAYLTTRLVGTRLSGRVTGGGRGRHLTVVEQISLGKEAKLLLVRLEDHCLLLGVTQSGVTCLKELSQEEVAAWQEGEDGETLLPGPSFRQQLEKLLAQRKKP